MSTTLKELQQTLTDGVEGFTIAAESVKDPGLKTLFSGFAAEREEMAHELKEYAHAESEEDASVTGALHRGWIELKSKLTSGDDHAILAECERGEDHALKVFREEVDGSLPPEARATINSISTRILAVHNKVKELRDASQAA
jgi:uncharacterized protein (TIGR02284 family)